MSTVSGAALLLGVLQGTARAAGTTVSTAAHPPITVTSASALDFIFVTTGGTVVGSITNSGTIGPKVGGVPTPNAIEVSGGGNVTGSIINDTFLSVTSVTASCALPPCVKGLISDDDIGIAIFGATTLNDPVGGAILNKGLISVADASPGHDLHGILVTGTAVSSAITNLGTISVSIAGSGMTGGQAVGIELTSTGTLLGSVTNAGILNVNAVATGSFSQSAAAAGLIMFNPTSIVVSTGEMVQAKNSGSVSVSAVAKDTGGFESFAGAVATGVSQVIAGAATTISAAFTNTLSASMTVLASASVTGSAFFNTASAVANGIRQNASGGKLTTSTFTNDGSFDVKGIAKATDTGLGGAIANALGSFEVSQKATATGVGSVAKASLTNTNAFSLNVSLTATATAGPFASALAVVGGDQILQSASKAQTATATLVNSGTISGKYTANAKATGTAVADAGIITTAKTGTTFTDGNFIKQSVAATGTGTGVKAGSATAKLSNSGTILLDVDGNADVGIFGSAATATAAVDGDILNQQGTVFGTGTAAASFTNAATGTFTAKLDAFARGLTAKAFASIGGATLTTTTMTGPTPTPTVTSTFTIGNSVIDQNVGVFGGGGTATAGITNSGTFLIDLKAGASGLSAATATAQIDGQAVDQFAIISGAAGGTASTLFSNSKTFDVKIAATASAPLGGATALAKLGGAGIEQDALVFGAGTNVATASIANSGSSLSFDLDALTLGKSAANATAIVTGPNAVIDQSAIAGGGGVSNSASATLTNTLTGNLSVTLDAIFLEAGLFGSATGLAKLSAGAIEQLAVATGKGVNTASASISNAGTMLFDLSAAGFGINVGKASAIISSAAIDQDAIAGAATVSLSNSNSLTFRINASATTFAGGTAKAVAGIIGGSGIDQNATGTGGPGSSASALISNTASILFNLDAFASGSTGAIATAVIDFNAIDQNALGDTASVTITNGGGFRFELDASAVATDGTANALAAIGVPGAGGEAAIEQQAGATTGTISSSAKATLTNTNNLIINLGAKATGKSSAKGTASIANDFIIQSALASGTSAIASVSLSNTGNLSALLDATAIDGSGNATANARMGTPSTGGDGIDQFASVFGGDLSGQSATAKISNSGDITFDLNALAQASTTAIANAIIEGDVFSQSAIVSRTASSLVNDGTGSATLTNSATGTISVLLNATAQGTVTATNVLVATAIARIDDSVIDQNAVGGKGFTTMTPTTPTGSLITTNFFNGSGAVTFTNNGIFDIDVIANATATGAAKALASMEDEAIDQGAEGQIASAKITNTNSFTALLDANASATNGKATATATLDDDFIEQRVGTTTAGESSTITLTNSAKGTFGLTVSASAAGESIADANAKLAGNFIDQIAIASTTAFATITNTASAAISNDGILQAIVDAKAVAATGTADARAIISGAGLFQRASATLTATSPSGPSASVSLTNSKTILFDVGAFASGKSSATALASMFGDVVLQSASAIGVTGAMALATMTNSGTFSALFAATAVDAIGDAHATARISEGGVISQDADASAAFGKVTATSGFTNSGTFLIDLDAKATGSTSADARAFIGDDIVQQDASVTGGGADTAAASFSNTSTASFSVLVNATASADGTGAIGSADATASIHAGFDQNVFGAGTGTKATADITNAGSFLVDLNAKAIGTGATSFATTAIEARATVSLDMVNQGVGTASTGSATFTNSGNFKVLLDATALATTAKQGGTSALALAGISATGIQQLVIATGGTIGAPASATAKIANTGTTLFDIAAKATADNTARATAGFVGDVVNQRASASGVAGAGSALASFTNSGTGSFSVLIDAVANTADSANFALALAGVSGTGFEQDVVGSGLSGSTATAKITNSASILFDINAAASGGAASATAGFGTAKAGGDFIDQSVSAANTASATLTNSAGSVKVLVDATATATSAKANASAGFDGSGIDQRVVAFGVVGTSAKASITNSALFLFDVGAFASGKSTATALATMGGNVINQTAIAGTGDGAVATATIANSGTFSGLFAATAIDAIGDASAKATIGGGVFQNASASGDEGFIGATVGFTNSGSFLLDLDGKATASTDADAFAIVGGDVFEQIALAKGSSADSATAKFANTGTGTISVLLNVTASATSGLASAKASITGTGIDQNATAIAGPSDTAKASLTNSAEILFDLNAKAIGKSSATATALIAGDVVNQFASANTATVTFSNATTAAKFTVALNATATDLSGSASALAQIGGTGIEQIARGGLSVPNSATANLSNSGTLLLDLNASASASTMAKATALIGGDAIRQFARLREPSVILTNSAGTISILLDATAKAAPGKATAKASIAGTGIDQDASFAANGPAATAKLTNNSTILFDFGAFASGGSSASAVAGIGVDLVNQFAWANNLGTALASISNTGAFSALFNATAKDLSGNATALARIGGTGIEQDASIPGAFSSKKATANLTNSGVLLIDLNASASAKTTAKASALIGADGINQRAFVSGAAAALASLSNSSSGSIAIKMDADASATGGKASALASIGGTGIEQDATSLGGGSATAKITNSAAILLDLNAKAVGKSSATATALIAGDAVNQLASAVTATVTFSNATSAAKFTAALNATATDLFGSASALAQIGGSGIDQNAAGTGGAGSKATAGITNNGTFKLALGAKANALTSADATARIGTSITGADAVNQFASGESASVSLTNAGTFNVLLDATALASDTVSAPASALASIAGDGIDQLASATGSGTGTGASATLTNSKGSTMLFDLNASASGATNFAVKATANLDETMIAQKAVGSSASVSLTNDASITGKLNAKASNTRGAASALATIGSHGFNQSVVATFGVTPSATATLTNNGSASILLDLDALALGTDAVNATAKIAATAIKQNIGGETAKATFNNAEGSITVMLDATAIGTGTIGTGPFAGSATANALVGAGIRQNAGAIFGSGGAATATFTNNGPILFDLFAEAGGSVKASANASMFGDFFLQNTTGTSAKSAITNTASLSVLMDANATATLGSASAFAGIGGTGSAFDQNAMAAALGGGGKAQATLNNTNTILFDFDAKAVGKSSATATVSVAKDFVNQSALAVGSTSATAAFTNSGSMKLVQDATATDLFGNAKAIAQLGASASNGTGIEQDAVVTGAGAQSATAKITNSGAFTLDFDANASAKSLAVASALVNGGLVDQTAKISGTGSAIASISNAAATGSFNVTLAANATATASTGKASASAGIAHNVFDQNATATLVAGNTAKTIFTNNGTVSLDLNVFASAHAGAKATASIGGDILNQSAKADNTTMTFTNNGGFTLDLDATAIATAGPATAIAFFGDGIAQSGVGAGAGSVVNLLVTNNNSFVLDAQATATAGKVALAKAFVSSEIVDQDANAETASAKIVNTGTLGGLFDANASATVSSVAVATVATAFAGISAADAFAQNATATAFGSLGVASATISNLGTSPLAVMGVSAFADAIAKTSAKATATISGDLIAQFAAGNTATAKITNSGVLSAVLDAFASGTAGKATALATLDGTGIDQNASAIASTGGVGSASLINTNSILFDLDAKAVGKSSAKATATIANDVVNQLAFGTAATALFSNTGTLSALLNATATDLAGNATALAKIGSVGIEQDASAIVGAGGKATATLTNTGTILFDLNALANASAPANARASILGNVVDQRAKGTSATVNFSNSGSFKAILDADAVASKGAATAQAIFSASGVYQSARATFGSTGGLASAVLINSATMTFAAMANATGKSSAKATASMDSEIFDQSVRGVTAKGTFTNNGTLTALLAAKAVATGTARALANFDSEILEQSGINATFGVTGAATAKMTNTSTIMLTARATATGGDGGGSTPGAFATATASGEVIDQFASGNSASVSFTNMSEGFFGFALDANAKATEAFAGAIARVSDDLVEQTANAVAGSSPGAATAAFSNTGDTVMFALSADATGKATGNALASVAEDGIGQVATGKSAKTVVTNNGLLSIGLHANASGTTGKATATAAIGGTVIEQDAKATISGGGAASATITNTATVLIDLDAKAVGKSSATAKATIISDVVNQLALGTAATVLFSNTGTLSALLNATATDLAGNATAKADIGSGILNGTGIDQDASAVISGGGTAKATITNTGTVLFDLNAKAIASTIANATAIFDGKVVGQRAAGKTATISLTNSNSFRALLNATASATGNGATGNAKALAIFDSVGIHQSAVAAVGVPVGAASAGLTNSGTMVLAAMASAKGTAKATATAAFSAFGDVVQQFSLGKTTSGVTLTNSGTFLAMLDATAQGTTSLARPTIAVAKAQFGDTGIEQDALATFTGPGGGTATATLTNSNSLTFAGMALALGSTTAKASATFGGDVFNQRAVGDLTSVTLTNSGKILAMLDADASATAGTAKALASITGDGIEQDASAVFGTPGSATAKITNTNSILFDLDAKAVGLSSATASAIIAGDVVNQHAIGTAASVLFTNTGTVTTPAFFTAVLNATATDLAGNATAKASIGGTGIEQDASVTAGGSGAAKSTLTNSGTILLDLNALANASTSAKATATYAVGGVVNQNAVGTSAKTVLTNTNSLKGFVDADAVATGSGAKGFAGAVAEFDGDLIMQRANATFGSGGAATATLSNAGTAATMLFAAQAKATGTTAANAKAFFGASFIDQGVTGVTADANITNSGTFGVFGTADAKALSGKATALAEVDFDAIEQTAKATVSPGGVGSANITNTNSFTLGLNADASASTLAKATAFYDGIVIDQTANGTSADATISNAKGATLLVSGNADARASAGFAGALAEFDNTGIDQSALATVGAGGAATALIDNDGIFTLMLDAKATATGAKATGTGAKATAFFDGDVIDQNARGVTADADITNDGTLTIIGKAFADAKTAKATARAEFDSRVIDQTASASVSPSGAATADITNTSSFTLALMATATGATGAKATAFFDGTVVDQRADGASGKATISNAAKGTFTISGAADADAATGPARALAEFDTRGILQNATGTMGTGGAATALIDNDGLFFMTLDANAKGTGAASATGRMAGEVIRQNATGKTASATLDNSATFMIGIEAFASGSTADAIAIVSDTVVRQSATATFAGGGLATAKLINTNSFLVDLDAQAIALSSATATALITDDVVNQLAIGTAASALFTNTGTTSTPAFFTVALNATATDAAGNASAFASIAGTGIAQDAIAITGAGGAAKAGITNNGTVLIDINAKATIAAGPAFAAAKLGFATFTTTMLTTPTSTTFTTNTFTSTNDVVNQFAGGKSATATLTNSGSFTATLDADAKATAGSASAVAAFADDGIFQSAIATFGGGGAAAAKITNTNSMLFDLDAKAVGKSSAMATATIAGDVVNQSAVGTTASVAFSNLTSTATAANFTAVLNATATDASGNAKAIAGIFGTGIEQDASAFVGAGGAASAAITNTGTVLFDVNAKAFASTFATATASVGDGVVDQRAFGDTATVSLTNSNSFRALLNATASATGNGKTGNARALATFDSVGIHQSALGTLGAPNIASASLTNSATMVLAAMASAKGTVDVRATAGFSTSGDVVLQFAIGRTASATLTNSGTFLAMVDATAQGTTSLARPTLAVARARFRDSGIEQTAIGTGGGINSGTVLLTNSSSLTFAGMALALGSNTVVASATFGGDVFNQRATGQTASATLTNSSKILAMLDADASATVGTARAIASITGDGIEQDVSATSGAGGLATAKITNTNSILFDLDAKAVSKSLALASAIIAGDVVDQFATGTSASVTFNNSTSAFFTAVLNATATDFSDKATAHATISGTGIKQTANGLVGAGGSGKATITNDGTLLFSLNASANASTLAKATARMGGSSPSGDFVSQNAAGKTASATFTNNGTFTARLNADASSTNQNAFASALAPRDGIQQNATATISGSTSATAKLINTNSILFDLDATATGAAKATANAFFNQDGVDQFARAIGSTALATFVNATATTAPGTFVINAHAFASGSTADANARGGTAIRQSAAGTSGTPVTNAKSVMTNNGTINVTAMATAFGTNGASGLGAIAKASASIDSGIDQRASSAFKASSTFTNNGSMVFNAIANASHAVSATAFATVDSGIHQNATATSATGSTATNTITNTSNLTFAMTGFAKATGSTFARADASNSEELIDQFAGTAETAKNIVDNTGTMTFLLQAVATASVGKAIADVSYGTDDTVMEFDAIAVPGKGSVASNMFDNSGTFSLIGRATANGVTSASASVTATDTIFDQFTSGETATGTINNSGAFTFLLTANAKALSGPASALASFDSTVFDQNVNGTGGNASSVATADFTNTNTGTMLIGVMATAFGSGGTSPASFVQAFATFDSEVIDQSARAATAKATVTNDNSLTIRMDAKATATDGVARAFARMSDTNIDQNASATAATFGTASSATATFTNSNTGTFNVFGNADAKGTAGATASAIFTNEAVIAQFAFGGATVLGTVSNAGILNVMADANATATSGAALAVASFGDDIIFQGVSAASTNGVGKTATANFTNSGTLNAIAMAKAVGSAAATAKAALNPGTSTDAVVDQSAFQGTTLSLNVTNSASFNALFQATASGTNVLATAAFRGVDQSAAAETASKGTTTFNNTSTGTFDLDANAFATANGGAAATATARVLGVIQQTSSSASAAKVLNSNFNNSGSFTVNAKATAAGATTTEVANAFATGYKVAQGGVDRSAVLDVDNTGTFTINATAIGSTANAIAKGMSFNAGSISGSVNNTTTMNVTASAPGGTATATGVEFNADIFTGTFTNTGTVKVLAIGSTTAVGLRVGTSAAFANTMGPVGGEEGRLTNDSGLLWAGVMNGSLTRGTAIDISGAPNTVVIDWQANTAQNFIFGNVEMSMAGRIEVTNGMTRFDGIVNTGGGLTGDMTIFSGGSLTLVDNTSLGIAVVNVDTYSQTNNGTIIFEVHAETTTTGQINADVANLDGTVLVLINPGLYDSRTYEEVVTAATARNGTWDTLGFKSATTFINPNSPLLQLQAIYQPDDTVDLALIRNSFAAAACTPNQAAAGSGIDAVFSTTLTGAFGTLIGDLFTLDQNGYCAAMEQLHGAEHAENLRATLRSLDILHYAVGDRINSGPFSNDLRNNRDSIIQRGDTAIWANAQGSWGELDGDGNSPGFELKQYGFYVGVDHNFTDDLLLGFVAGYYKSELDFINGSHKEDDGVQLGIYGAYDTQVWYVRGGFGWSQLDAESRRSVNVVSTVGTASAMYDIRVISFKGEGGRRFEIGTNSFLTPFAGFSYTSARNDAFTEIGATGANLAASQNTFKSFMSELGVRWSGAFETGKNSLVIPEVALSWRHEFKDLPTFVTSFAAAPGSTFGVVPAVISDDIFVVDAGIAIATSNKYEIKANYWGQFNNQITQHGGGIRLTIFLNGNRN